MTSPAIASAEESEIFDPLNPSNVQDPFPFLARLREDQPIYWNSQRAFWMLTRYQDVKAALQNATQFSSAIGADMQRRAERFPEAAQKNFAVGHRFFYGSLIAAEPPQHKPQRQAVMKVFSPRVIGGMHSTISNRVERLLDGLEQEQTFDFVERFAYPLPSLVIFDLLGIPSEHHETIREGAAALVSFPPSVYQSDFARIEHIAERMAKSETVLKDLIRQRRAVPTQDLISLLANESDMGLKFPDDEIVVLCNFLLVAGHETTANLLGGSMRYLLQDRALWDQLRAAPELIENAVEELLRFVSPVLWVSRVAGEDIEIGTHVIRKGTRIQLGIGSGNHDPREFKDPDSIDFTRPKPHSLAFGYGAHFCVGAALARMEAQIALSALLRRLPDIRLVTDKFEYQPLYFLRALKALPVAV
jgi:cytochrome P450